MSENKQEKIPIICIHGIRRKDKWYETLEKKLDPEKYQVIVFENTYWTVFRLLFPFLRKRINKKFEKFYSNIIDEYTKKPNLICHSFGSYIFYSSIKKYNSIKFDKVIMVGSILSPLIRWDEHFKGSDPQIRKMLHEYGAKDEFVWLTKPIEDCGNAGEVGFTNIKKPKTKKNLRQIQYDNFDHSSYFLPPHINDSWVPFLVGKKLDYDERILRPDEIIPRLYENIDNLIESNSEDFNIDRITYKARIDKKGNYFLNYTFNGRIKSDNPEYFYFKSSADSNTALDDKNEIIVKSKNGNQLDIDLDQSESFKITIKVDCESFGTEIKKHSNFELNFRLCWKEVMNLNRGDTDHFAIGNIQSSNIELNFPYKLKNPIFLFVTDNEIKDNLRANIQEMKDGTYSYSIDIDNEAEDIDGLIFYYSGKTNADNRKMLPILETKIKTLNINDKQIDFRICNEKDIHKVYFLEKNKIEFENAATEESLRKRKELFPYGFIVAYDNDRLVGYVESLIINDWNFKKFSEISNFEKIYDINGETLYVIFIAVDPEYRGKGIASSLLGLVEEVAKNFEVKKIKLIAKDEEIKLYKRNGFIPIDNLRNFLPESPINAHMEKSL